METIHAIAVSLGLGGIVVVALAALLTPRWRSHEILAGWLPLILFVCIVFAKARYMPAYFMSIAVTLAVIPAALALRYVRADDRWRRFVSAGTFLLSPLLLIGMTGPWQSMSMTSPYMVTDYVDHEGKNGERFHLANLWRLPDNGERERLRGLNPDARPLGLALADRAAPPDLIIIPADLEGFLKDFAQNPKRAEDVFCAIRR